MVILQNADDTRNCLQFFSSYCLNTNIPLSWYDWIVETLNLVWFITLYICNNIPVFKFAYFEFCANIIYCIPIIYKKFFDPNDLSLRLKHIFADLIF